MSDSSAESRSQGLISKDEWGIESWCVAVPKGNYWLRTGVYDRNSRKVGTMEIPLSAVKPEETAAAN